MFGCKDEDELTELVSKTYIELKQKDDRVKLIHAFTKLEMGDDFDIGTVQIMDRRTQEILETYYFNEICPSFYRREELDNIVLYYAFQNIRQTKPKLI